MASDRVNGPALRVIRQRSDMSIADVVAALAEDGITVNPDHLRNIELGHKQPSEKLLGGIARALKVPRIVLLASPHDEPVSA